MSLRGRPLQVIVKFASLELQPGESYPGGTWHVEGTLDERIVATACCYLENSNVQGGDLAFRVSVHEPRFPMGDHQAVEIMYVRVGTGSSPCTGNRRVYHPCGSYLGVAKYIAASSAAG